MKFDSKEIVCITIVLLLLPAWFKVLDLLNNPPRRITGYYPSEKHLPDRQITVNSYNVQIPESFQINFGNDLTLQEYQH